MILNNFVSIILYIAVFSLAAFLIYLAQRKNNKTLVIVSMLLITVFSAIRLNAGTDTATYRKFFNQVANESDTRIMERFNSGEMEPFILFTARLGGILKCDAWFLFGIFAFITVFFLYLATKKLDKKNYWLLFGVMLIMVYPNSFNTMRQMAAMSILSYLLADIMRARIDKRYTKFTKIVLLSCFAVTIHYSSIVLLPVLLIPYITSRFGCHKAFCAIAILSVLIVVLYKPALSFLASSSILSSKHYGTFMGTDGSLINFNFLICGLLAIVGFFHYRYHKSKSSINEYYLPILMAGVAYSVIGFYSAYLGRLADFFWPFSILMLWHMLNEMKEPKINKIAIIYAIAIAYFLLAFVIMDTNHIIPYDIAIGAL